MEAHVALHIRDASHTGAARRQAAVLAGSLGFDSADAGRLALVVTEAATNIVKHAGKGHILLRALREVADKPGVEILALDQGPGMSNVGHCMQDGYSTAGSPGTGLGAISRLATSLEIYSVPSHGTVVLARVLPRGATMEVEHPPLSIGAVRVAAPGETECGDAWSATQAGRRAMVMVADGLGHGGLAAKAAQEAIAVFQANSHLPLPDILKRAHGALLATRGAAVSVAELDLAAAEVRFCGIGNVGGFVSWPAGSRSMVTQNGTVGGQLFNARTFSYPWKPASLLIMHTDGLNSHTSVDGYPGLLSRHPSLVAGVLYRDFVRGKDDATVVVVTEKRAGT